MHTDKQDQGFHRFLSKESDAALFGTHRWITTSYGGIFLFIPLIIDLPTLFESTGFYGSTQIPSVNYMMNFLALKLIGKDRLSFVVDLNFDYGMGLSPVLMHCRRALL